MKEPSFSKAAVEPSRLCGKVKKDVHSSVSTINSYFIVAIAYTETGCWSILLNKFLSEKNHLVFQAWHADCSDFLRGG